MTTEVRGVVSPGPRRAGEHRDRARPRSRTRRSPRDPSRPAGSATPTCTTARAGSSNDFPFLLGHEAAGTVEAVGPGVISVAPGDFVILELAGGLRPVPVLPARQALVLLLRPSTPPRR